MPEPRSASTGGDPRTDRAQAPDGGAPARPARPGKGRGSFMSGFIFLAVAGGFIGLLFLDLGSTQQKSCSLCVQYGGRTACGSGQGVDEDAAQQSARTVACAQLSSGPTDAFRCQAAPPQQLECK